MKALLVLIVISFNVLALDKCVDTQKRAGMVFQKCLKKNFNLISKKIKINLDDCTNIRSAHGYKNCVGDNFDNLNRKKNLNLRACRSHIIDNGGFQDCVNLGFSAIKKQLRL